MAERRPGPRPALVALACAAAIVAGALALLLPPLLERTTGTSSTPVRRDAVAHDVALAPGARACVADAPLDRDSARARLWVRRAPAAGATLRVTATAPGQRASGTATASAPADDATTTVNVPLAPAPSAPALGRVCVANESAGTVVLVGTDHPRALVRTSASLDGAPVRYAPSLSLLQAPERTTLARTSELVHRVAALSPFGPWLLWALIPLLAVGVPALVVAALWRAVAADEER